MTVSTAELYRQGCSADHGNLVQTIQDIQCRTDAPYRTLEKLPILAFRPKINTNVQVVDRYKLEFAKLLSEAAA